MAVNAHVERNGNESTPGLIRRFSRRVQGSEVLLEVRGRRYHERSASKLTTKKRAIKLLSRRAKYMKLFKLGKIVERRGKGARKGR